jgi:hypothetical protein
MTGLTWARPLRLAALLALCLALVIPAGAIGATTRFTDETRQAFEQQLNKGELQSAVINKKLRSLRITLKSGSLFLYHYERKGEPALVQTLTAKHVPVTVLKKAEAAKELPAKSKKLRLRYIALIIVAVVIVIVGIVLVVNRRRRTRD